MYNQQKLLCFKPMRNIHDSGYRYIQYGYIWDDEQGNEQVEVIGRYDIIQMPFSSPIPFNLDLTKSGWFRIMQRIDHELEWQYGGTIAIKVATPKTDQGADSE